MVTNLLPLLILAPNGCKSADVACSSFIQHSNYNGDQDSHAGSQRSSQGGFRT